MDKTIKIVIFYLIGIVILALFAPLFLALSPEQINYEAILVAPQWTHPMGTDQFGRDIFIRIIYGARISLSVGFIAVFISLLIGISYGAVAGYLGGRVDRFLMKIVDILLALPTIFIILTVQVVLKPSIVNIMIVIGLTSWMGLARLVRAEFHSIKRRLYVLRSRAFGFKPLWIIVRDILPNAMVPILVSASLAMASAILMESTLSFLGLGVQPPTPSWGNMLMDAQEYLSDAWWMAAMPGIFILVTVLAFNFLGEYLQSFFMKRGLNVRHK
jgi:peptide/nickel transport system permease protein